MKGFIMSISKFNNSFVDISEFDKVFDLVNDEEIIEVTIEERN
jgi:hypothetical protein